MRSDELVGIHPEKCIRYLGYEREEMHFFYSVMLNFCIAFLREYFKKAYDFSIYYFFHETLLIPLTAVLI